MSIGMKRQTQRVSDRLPTSTHSDLQRQAAVGWWQHTGISKLTRRKMAAWLNDLGGGQIHFNDGSLRQTFGSVHTDLQASWDVSDHDFYRLMALDGSLGMAESYLRGHWDSDDLLTLLRVLCRNLERADSATTRISAMAQRLRYAAFRFDDNSRSGSQRHIAAHYDLSNEFFALFLDPTMMYSAAWFDHETTTLEDASIAKLDRVCRKLNLQSTDHVVELGTGWGGFSLHAAKQFGCQVTTTTISKAQYCEASDRVRQAGLGDRIQTRCDDYRDLSGQFDKLVSIEMIEAVGEQHLDTYFRQCDRLLKPGGRCVLQAIVMPERRYESYRRSVDFIQKYIFPGGFLPSVAAIQQSVGRASTLRLDSIEDLSTHYAKTLGHWRQRFLSQLDEVRSLGFDDRFIRMWEYYLCYCEAAFREQTVRVVQIVWDKPTN
ncbi:cyclopropane-fatty-acyl-phospholipid synthase family protein [Stieleria sp. TO1_6]|uniref:SAM-dependent methyltransferase n=1 Tax=Stieleria tagensis TaxID=2956795 RepID=UPI00209B75B6|nr:cyclopropane-fatty-acyl-phospholipid synthase family protein [Stieleria tagensis]MCO8122052.1 cyclopropane-fatty-acyl-phospholipid synthase family protein [Stieleria tagensis]